MSATLLNTLYITSPNAWLNLQGETVIIKIDQEKKLQVPLHHIGSIVGFGDVILTPQLMKRCAEDGRTIVHLDRHGRFICRMEGAVSGNILLRKAQFQKEGQTEFCFETARTIVAGKLQNSRNMLLRSARDCKDERDVMALRQTAQRLAQLIQSLNNCVDIPGLRGIEGDGSKEYFQIFSSMLRQQRDQFAMTVRSRRPPRDRINAILSFLYTLLMSDCRSALEGVGLDPQLGFLHVPRPGRASFALDLMEEFRSVIADRIALALINRKQVAPKHFEDREGGAVYLTEEGIKAVIGAYQQKKQDSLIHPFLNQKTTIGLLPHLQARLMARYIRGEMEGYLPFILK